ncbi:MAG TPA: hypothetical protein VHA82_01640 [Ramlibacter sp.]|nr:hypothetical protein [Ramlibacter sp.]
MNEWFRDAPLNDKAEISKLRTAITQSLLDRQVSVTFTLSPQLLRQWDAMKAEGRFAGVVLVPADAQPAAPYRPPESVVRIPDDPMPQQMQVPRARPVQVPQNEPVTLQAVAATAVKLAAIRFVDPDQYAVALSSACEVVKFQIGKLPDDDRMMAFSQLVNGLLAALRAARKAHPEAGPALNAMARDIVKPGEPDGLYAAIAQHPVGVYMKLLRNELLYALDTDQIDKLIGSK